MTDETELTEQQEQSNTKGEDSRFEVKWSKKGGGTASAPPTVEPGVAVDESDLRRQLEEERQRTTELRDKWQRAAADLVNLRKRTEQEREEEKKFASMLLVYDLLPVLDNFERALQTIPGNLRNLSWIDGMLLIERHLRAILEHQGLSVIEAQGQPFNPHLHEAIAEQETSDAAPGTVVQEYQRGYTMHGRVIRPALVEVAKEAATTGAAPEPAQPAAEQIATQAEEENTGP